LVAILSETSCVTCFYELASQCVFNKRHLLLLFLLLFLLLLLLLLSVLFNSDFTGPLFASNYTISLYSSVHVNILKYFGPSKLFTLSSKLFNSSVWRK